jgi:hypothetical protein
MLHIRSGEIALRPPDLFIKGLYQAGPVALFLCMIVGYVDLPAAIGCIFIPQPVFLKLLYENQYQTFLGNIIKGHLRKFCEL